jgi:hypothetical protein
VGAAVKEEMMSGLERLKLSDWSPSQAREALRAELYQVLQAQGEGEGSEAAVFLRAAIDDEGTHAGICERPEDFAMTCLDLLGHVPGWSR